MFRRSIRQRRSPRHTRQMRRGDAARVTPLRCRVYKDFHCLLRQKSYARYDMFTLILMNTPCRELRRIAAILMRFIDMARGYVARLLR